MTSSSSINRILHNAHLLYRPEIIEFYLSEFIASPLIRGDDCTLLAFLFKLLHLQRPSLASITIAFSPAAIKQ